MDLKAIIQSAVDKFVASKTTSLSPRSAAAIQAMIDNALILLEEQALSRLIKDLAAKYPEVVTLANAVPELKALLA